MHTTLCQIDEYVFSACLCPQCVWVILPLWWSVGAKKHWYGKLLLLSEVTALCWMWIVLLLRARSEMNSSLCKMLPQWDKTIVPCLVWFQFLAQQWCEILTKCQWEITAPQRDTMRTNVTSDHGWKTTGKTKQRKSFFSPTEQLLTPTLSWSILYQDCETLQTWETHFCLSISSFHSS